ncbi:DUF4913 domain-containing protein [Amnibacterium endophyticum]|uniref:DUF4913 domain-containing protein n=1 Tax=Amnibacterium endophyticum TaxID=2109337 RepID=A0ABW4LG12_9MICO
MTDDEDDAFGDSASPDLDQGAERAAVSTYYGSADEWFRRYWRYTYRRRVSPKGTGTGRWRADWWANDEARQRIEALWRSWEACRRDPGTGVSAWWINHADPQMSALLAVDGCFAASSDENLPGDPLPYTEPPPGLFAPDRSSGS